MAKRMPRRLVALSSSAIAAIYVAGYLSTQAADARLAGGENRVAAAIASTSPTPVGPGVPRTAAAASFAAPSAVTARPTSASVATSGYRDGTYQGVGRSRRGDVAVSVTIQGGRIANAAIIDASTQYPISRIAALPGQVVARQSSQVDRVTGATYSMMAFQQAVQQALAQARTAGSETTAAQSAGSPAITVPGQPAPSLQPARPDSSQPAPSLRPARPAPAPLFPRRREWERVRGDDD